MIDNQIERIGLDRHIIMERDSHTVAHTKYCSLANSCKAPTGQHDHEADQTEKACAWWSCCPVCTLCCL